MFKNILNFAVLLVGFAVVCWIGAGYVGSNALGATITLVIGACYLAGAFELRRYRQATCTLTNVIVEATTAPLSLRDWLGRLHPSLRNAVRLRIEGERVALPGPALTPYLVGLLVLLGMLGTLLGMMATLRGTGLALESATDLEAIRGSLASPVKGLAFAFGTSIAGVATSAMLGLLSALCRHERLHAVQLLDVEIATTLHTYSRAYQRDEAFKLQQHQAELMPALIDRLQVMMATIEQQSAATNERLLARHEDFHAKTETVYLRLASSVEQSLKDGVVENAQAFGAALQPVMETTMENLARQTVSLHGTVTNAVQRQLDGLSAGFEKAAAIAGDSWNAALAEQQRSNQTLTLELRHSLERFADAFDQRSAGLLEAVSMRLDTTIGQAANAWDGALSRQQAVNEDLANRNQQALTSAATSFEGHATSLVGVMQQSHADLQAQLESRDQQRLAVWTETFGSMTAALNSNWERIGELAAGRQQEICDTLARTANDISAQAQIHASDTIAEISRLAQVASEAPKAAAEVVAEVRQKLSESMARDTSMLEERGRLLATLESVLTAVNQASSEQREAVDALVATSADLLDRVGGRFVDHVEAETGKLEAVAAQVNGSAIEVASLGEAFGMSVQLFGKATDALTERLQHISSSLDASLARSDEQLAYYVAQAREVIDLSMLSQKQIIAELHQLAGRQTSVEIETT
jgi:hypothetical protein